MRFQLLQGLPGLEGWFKHSVHPKYFLPDPEHPHHILKQRNFGLEDGDGGQASEEDLSRLFLHEPRLVVQLREPWLKKGG